MDQNNRGELVNHDLQNHVLPIISNDGLEQVINLTENLLVDVRRYTWPALHLDYEMLTSIDYSIIAQNIELNDVMKVISQNGSLNFDADILYLSLRTMTNITWKLDALLLTHLKECVKANTNWSFHLFLLAHKLCADRCYNFSGLPYWLRNEQTALIENPIKGYGNVNFANIELIMVKANDIQAQHSILGDTHFIEIDYGIYVYLYEWSRVFLSGYRMKLFSDNTLFSLTEPIKTAAKIIKAIVEMLVYKKSIKNFTPPAMILNKNDPLIIKEIVMCQIDFILSHEYGHIFIDEKKQSTKSIEIEADAFALKWIMQLEGYSTYLFGNQGEDQQFTNDIQSKNNIDKKIESIEILFAFFSLFYYISERIGKCFNQVPKYPEIEERRYAIRSRYEIGEKSPLIEYVDSFTSRVKEVIDSSII